ncbi:NADH-quinone oxidoreductase subunit E [Anaerolineales bacterium]|nr:NADH-quinone oxidoreductase subunit E [Anaerolineales bacterium]
MSRLETNIPTNDPLMNPEKRVVIDRILAENKGKDGAVMVALNELQSEIGYITESMEVYVARKLRVPVSAVHGVTTFYSFFTNRPRGKHTIKFCLGTACYVGGTPQLIEKAKQLLGIDVGQTTPDGNVTLEVCRCVGACSQAPVMVLDDEVEGRVRSNIFPELLAAVSK